MTSDFAASSAPAPTTNTSPDPEPRELHRTLAALHPRRLAVSSRVMLALTAIAALGMLAATVVFWWSEDRVREQAIHADLVQELEELRTLANGLDPETGEPFTTASALMATFLSRNVPGQQEGFLVLIDDQIPYVSPFDEGIAMETMPEMIELGRAVEPGDSSMLTRLEVDGREYAVASVPVDFAADPAHGVFLAAADITAIMAQTERVRLAQSFVMIGVVLVIGLTAATVVHLLLRPLRQLAAQAEHITEEDLSERIPETGSDDIAGLSRTVNGMLDRLESAFQGQRELLDDVGHELRTPLTIIRGHLELLDADDPADVRETTALVMDETDRMARLVEELVLLAKSMRPDFVHLRPLQIDDVVHSLMDRSQPLGERRWRIDHLSGAEVMADSQRLLQAGLQLMSNAMRHTSENDEIGVGSAVDGDVVRLWVRDTGEGVPASEKQSIFERAVRGASGRDQGGRLVQRGSIASSLATSDTTSSGLGLSIVTAIAQAHGGRVTLASTHGAGSTFAIELPLVTNAGADPEHDADADQEIPA